MKHECSLQQSQQPANFPYPEPVLRQSIPKQAAPFFTAPHNNTIQAEGNELL
jgi:hypothetical protein